MKKSLVSARKLVSSVLDCRIDEIDIDTAIYRHPLWDSLGHLKILLELEKKKLIEINDATVDYYVSIVRISELFE